MAHIDENHEAVAHIRMIINNDAQARKNEREECEYRQQEEDDNAAEPVPDSASDVDAHWKFGARLNLTDSLLIETSLKSDQSLRNFKFHKSLCKFLSENVAPDCVSPGDPIKVSAVCTENSSSCFLNSDLYRSDHISVFI
jgi:hypothetical protein